MNIFGTTTSNHSITYTSTQYSEFFDCFVFRSATEKQDFKHYPNWSIKYRNNFCFFPSQQSIQPKLRKKVRQNGLPSTLVLFTQHTSFHLEKKLIFVFKQLFRKRHSKISTITTPSTLTTQKPTANTHTSKHILRNIPAGTKTTIIYQTYSHLEN